MVTPDPLGLTYSVVLYDPRDADKPEPGSDGGEFSTLDKAYAYCELYATEQSRHLHRFEIRETQTGQLVDVFTLERP